MTNKNSSEISKTDKKQTSTKQPLYIFLHIPKTGGTTFTQHLRKNSKPEQWTTYNNLKNLVEEQKQKIKYISGHETYYGIHKQFPDKEPRYILFLRDPAYRRVSQYNHDVSRMDCSEKNKPGFKKWYKSQIKDELCFLLNKKYKGIPGRKAPAFTHSFQRKLKIGSSKTLKMLGFKFLKLFYSGRNKKQELNNAKALLENCWFVTTTDNLDNDIPKLFNKLGIKGKFQRYRTSVEPGDSSLKNKELLNYEKKVSLTPELKSLINKDNPYDLKLYEYAKNLRKNKSG